MLLLGILSVLQLLALPGLLLIRLFPGRRTWIQQAAFVFVVSLLANYVVVFALVAVGFYLRSVVMLLFLAEVGALLWLHREYLLKPRSFDFRAPKAAFAKSVKSFDAWLKRDFWAAFPYLIFACLAALAIAWALGIWVQNFDTVFQAWDSWASWDRWAEKWASNAFPGDTWEYPQMVPILLSISYKFIGTTAVKFFGKSIMPLFALLVVLVLVDLGRRYRSYGYLIGAVLALYSLNLFLAAYFAEVYVDIPVASLSLLAIATLLAARDVRDQGELRRLLTLGSLTSAAAAVTKQTGVYVMALYPLFCYLWVLRPRREFRFRAALKWIGGNLLLALVIVVPWYAFIEFNILTGRSASNIEYVTQGIYAGQSYWQRFLAAMESLGGYAYWFAFLILSLFVVSSEFRHIILLIILPFSALWAVYLSYEYRNLAVALPLIAMSAGVAIEAWGKYLQRVLGRWRNKIKLPVYIPLVLMLALLGATSLAFNSEHLLSRQLIAERKMFRPLLNQSLYAYLAGHGGPQPVISNYPLGWLPDLEGMWRYDRFDDFTIFEQNLENFDDAELLLIPEADIDEQILQAVEQRLADGTYKLLFSEEDYRLIRLDDRN